MSSMVYVMAAVVAAIYVIDVAAMSPPRLCTGCYKPMDVNHPKVAALVTFYLEQKGTNMMLDEILSARKQTVAGMNYELKLRFHQRIFCGNPVRYICTVTIYEDLQSLRSISKQSCRIVQVPRLATEC